MRLFLLILLISASFGCGKRKLVDPIRTLGPEWMPVQIKDAEQAWIVPGEGSSLLIDSQCKKRDQDIPLNALTAQLLIGMTDQTLVEQKAVTFQDREALLSTFSLKIDGAKQMMRILVLKKEGCVFDVVLSTPDTAFDKRLPDFDKVVAMFSLEPSKK